jgi:retinol dehydrogenase-12
MDLIPVRSKANIVWQKLLLFPAIYGAYTELFTGLSPTITNDLNGSYIIPWGRQAKLKSDIEKATGSQNEGGTGASKRFYDWCETEVSAYM